MIWQTVVNSLQAVATHAAPASSKAPPAKRRKRAAAQAPEVCISTYLEHGENSEPREVHLDTVNSGKGTLSPESKASIDLLEESSSDSPNTRAAKLMWNMMATDLRYFVAQGDDQSESADLFQFKAPSGASKRLYDCLQWIYGLQRTGGSEVIDGVLVRDSMIDFDWTCNVLDIDAEWFRRVLARCMREQFPEFLRTISKIASPGFTHACETRLSKYVELSGWRIQ